ncbi:MAG: ATPase inhibitor subunit zeta [Pseudomonadota bacterium]
MSYLTEDAKLLEKKYQDDDMRKLYRMHARRARLLGLWAAEKIFIFGEKASDYAVTIVMADHAEPGGEGMRKKIEYDFKQNNIAFDENEFVQKCSDLLFKAESEILQENDVYA